MILDYSGWGSSRDDPARSNFLLQPVSAYVKTLGDMHSSKSTLSTLLLLKSKLVKIIDRIEVTLVMSHWALNIISPL